MLSQKLLKEYLPVFLDISQKRILLVGGGRVAHTKLKILIQFSKNILVVAPEINSEIQSMPGVICVQQKYSKEGLRGVDLVYACTQNAEVNQQIFEDARDLGILVNVVDNPRLSDFISPAVYRKGEMTVAVGSGGTDVHRAIAWRNRIKEIFESDND